MVNNELKPVLKQVEQARIAVRAFEAIILLNLNHGQSAPFGVQRIPALSEFLFLGQQLPAGREPVGSINDFGEFHFGCFHWETCFLPATTNEPGCIGTFSRERLPLLIERLSKPIVAGVSRFRGARTDRSKGRL